MPLTFLGLIALGTVLLMLPLARAEPGAAPFLTALFTATSAVCVTGLIVVDTPTYWSGFGQAVILLLFQLGGFGIMTGATLLGLLVSKRLGLQTRLIAQAETGSIGLGDVRDVLKLILVVTLAVEAVVAAWLSARLYFSYDEPLGAALWNGTFHAVSAFNNAGFSTYSQGMVLFDEDLLVLGPVMLAIIIGGLGFPVLHELRTRPGQWARWSVNTKITLAGTAVLLAGGAAAIWAAEHANPDTLGALDPHEGVLGALFMSVSARTAGFNAVDMGLLADETLAIHYLLMFIGGGSAGTAGGLKVTTFFLLGFVVWAEIHGRGGTVAFNRHICPTVQRQALTIVLLGIGVVGLATVALLSMTTFPMEDVVFEVISAFATVGLSTGLTPLLPPGAQLVLILLMYLGRVGTITVATALALDARAPAYRYPEERPIVG